MTSIQTQSIQAALLAAGSTLELSTTPIDATTFPSAGGPGCPVKGALRGALLMSLRRGSPARVVDIQITTFDAGATYTATIGGNAVAYSGAPGDVEEAATAWAAAIVADGTVGESGSAYQTTAEAVDSTGSGTADTVRITGLSDASWSFVATVTGTAEASVFLDPEAARVVLLGRYDGITSIATRITDARELAQASGWHMLRSVNGGDATMFVSDGVSRCLNADIAGVTVVRPYVTDVAGVSGDGSTSGAVTVTLLDAASIVLRAVQPSAT